MLNALLSAVGAFFLFVVAGIALRNLAFRLAVRDEPQTYAPRLRLKREGIARWPRPAEAVRVTRAFEAAGMCQLGDYALEGFHGHVRIRFFLHKDGTLEGTLFQQHKRARHVEVSRRFDDGTSVDAIDTAPPKDLPQPPWASIAYIRGATVAQLIADVESRSAGRKPIRSKAENLAKDFEESYARAMDWRAATAARSELRT